MNGHIRRAIEWKLRKHKVLKNMSVEHSHARDILFKAYSGMSYSTYCNRLREMAQEIGCIFSENTHSFALNEVFAQKIYGIPGFVPEEDWMVADVGAGY